MSVTSTIEQDASETPCHARTEQKTKHTWLSAESLAAPSVSPQDRIAPRQATRKRVQRRRLTVSLPIELLERSRNAVYWTKDLTLASLLEQALMHSLDQRERLNGQPFAPRLEDLKGGRPRSSNR